MTKISIIIPVYNCETYLETCIRSVFEQSLKELEIICINDGSTDDSVKVLEKLRKEDERIILLQQENQGAGVARNRGLRKARGKYVAFLDADDYYIDSNALEIMFKTCEKDNVCICGSMHMCMKGEEEHTYQVFAKETENRILNYKDYQMDYFYQNYLFQRKLLVDNKIVFPKYRRYQDPPFFVRAVYTAERFRVIDTCLYCYRMPEAATRYTTEKVCDLLRGLIDNLMFAKEHDLDLLFENTAQRIEYEFAYVIYENVSQDNLDLLKLLMKANRIISAEHGKPDFIIKPLRLILFSAEQYEEKLVQRIKSEGEIALYGAGKITRKLLQFIKDRNLQGNIKAIVVSDMEGNETHIEGIPVVPLENFSEKKDYFLLVTVGKKIAEEIAMHLNQNGYTNYEVIHELFGEMLLCQ